LISTFTKPICKHDSDSYFVDLTSHLSRKLPHVTGGGPLYTKDQNKARVFSGGFLNATVWDWPLGREAVSQNPAANFADD
jgi:hypothetical protein